MEPDRTDTNLLFGILAVKMNFIRKEDLFEAMGVWFLDRHKTLGEILVERQALSGKDRDLLDAMVRESQARQGQRGASGRTGPASTPRPGRANRSCRRRPRGRTRPPTAGENGCRRRRRDDGHLVDRGGGRRAADERYVVVRPHAKGGIGQVSVALDVALNREVALKELLDEHLDETGQPGAVPARGRGDGAAGASRDRPGLRDRLQRPGRAVLRDAIHQGRELQRGGPAVSPGPRPAAACATASRGSGSSSCSALRRRLRHDRVRAQPRRDPPRPEAVQRRWWASTARPWSWTGAWPSSSAGTSSATWQGRGDAPAVLAQRVDRHDRRHRRGDPGVHEPGAGGGGPGPGRVRQRRLRPGGDPLLPADRAESDHGPGGHDGPPTRAPRRVPPAARGQPRDPAGTRGDLPEGDGVSARGPVRLAPRRWRTTWSSGWPTSRCRRGRSPCG